MFKKFREGTGVLALGVSLVGCSPAPDAVEGRSAPDGDRAASVSGVHCEFMHGRFNWTHELVGPQEILDRQAAVDGDLSTYADIPGTGNQADPISPVVYSTFDNHASEHAGGTQAGVFMTLPDTTPPESIQLNTYLQGTLQDTGTGPTLQVTSTGGRVAAANYYSLATTKPFDQIELLLNLSVFGDVLVYEFCANGSVQ